MVDSPLWWLSILLIWAFAAGVLYFVILAVVRKPARVDATGIDSKKRFFIAWILIFLCWIPVFLAVYPGFFVYDATEEYLQVATRNFTTHHPLLHVLALGGSVCAGNKLMGSYNAGIALYTIVQMLILSATFAWVICKMKTVSYAISILWYGCFPTVVMFALCSAKDALFSAAMLAAVVLTIRIMDEYSQKAAILMGASLTLMMLFRHNGVYGFIVYAIVLIIYLFFKCKKDKEFKKNAWGIICILLTSFVLYIGIDKTLTYATHAQDIENQEILTVPIQQLARCVKAYKDDIAYQDLESIYEILPEEVISHYTPDLSDPVKAGFDNAAYAQNKGKYAEVWLRLFRKHPMGYINAWLNTCYGFFYPGTIVNVYAGHEVYTFTYTESSYFGYEVEHPGTRQTMLPVIDKLYRWLSLDDDIQKIPVISLLFSMGAIFWIYIICIAIMVYKKRSKEIIAFTLPGAIWLTLLLGPTFLPRYTVFLWFMLPYIIYVTINTGTQNEMSVTDNGEN